MAITNLPNASVSLIKQVSLSLYGVHGLSRTPDVNNIIAD